MKTRIEIAWFWLYMLTVLAMFVVGTVVKTRSDSPARINWLNDAVYYSTNSMVPDVERNKTRTTNDLYLFYYVKTVVTTNKVSSVYFNAGDALIELGARDDGVVVWRHAK